MIGVTRMDWAITMAVGVNSRPSSPRPRAREHQEHEQPDHHRRQAHAGIQQDHERTAAGKSEQRQRRAERHADHRGQRDGGQADLEREQHDLQKLGIPRDDQPQGMPEGGADLLHGHLRNPRQH